MAGGVSTSIGSGLEAIECIFLRPLKSGFSSEVSLSSTTAAVPMVGRMVGPVRFLLGVVAVRGGGGMVVGMNVCGLKVSFHSSAENLVPPGDSIGVSDSTRGCANFVSTGRILTGDRPLGRDVD